MALWLFTMASDTIVAMIGQVLRSHFGHNYSLLTQLSQVGIKLVENVPA